MVAILDSSGVGFDICLVDILCNFPGVLILAVLLSGSRDTQQHTLTHCTDYMIELETITLAQSVCVITLTGRGHVFDGGQRSSADVFGSFSPCVQVLLTKIALGFMVVIVAVRQLALRRQHPTASIPTTITHTMGGFARDVAVPGQAYSHIAHMEALLWAYRFFGVSLLLLQQTQASFLAAFILVGSTAITFELFTHEWLRNPVRVAAAQEARSLAGRASAEASAARAATLGVCSRVTGLPDSMGMKIADGAQKVNQDTHDLGISADEKVQADHGLVGFFSALASDGRASALGVRSQVTGLPDSMGMKIAGSAQKVKQDAHDLGISADEKVQADRGLAGFFSALASDGRAAALGVYSQVTGLPDSMGMNIAGAHKK